MNDIGSRGRLIVIEEGVYDLPAGLSDTDKCKFQGNRS